MSIPSIRNTELVAKPSATAFVAELAEPFIRFVGSSIRFSAEHPRVVFLLTDPGKVLSYIIQMIKNFLQKRILHLNENYIVISRRNKHAHDTNSFTRINDHTANK